MGIPYYYSYLIKKYNKKILIKFNNDNTCINYSFFDSNSIIYDVCKSEDNEYKIILDVCIKLNNYLKLFNCKELNYITFDGLPPFAKMEQQRSRRYKSYITKKLLKTDVLWDTCSITTGTEFMKNL
jgi:5'-3' exonuclease